VKAVALSDGASFTNIEQFYKLREKPVKRLMGNPLKTGSCRAWLKSRHEIDSQREFYK
jgi:hypothetical protein